MNKFIGRKRELKRLQQLLKKQRAQMIILKGRRRIGKSRLLREFGKNTHHTYVFSGLPPEERTTNQDQRDEFARQIYSYFPLRGLKTDDWGDLFWNLAQQCNNGKTLIVLDEISWMAMDDPLFLPKLKVAWELYFTKNPNIILALCGSVSIWIEKNIISSTGFMGRPSVIMSLNELPLEDCIKFWDHGGMVSPQEKLSLLAVTGGVPRYLEELDPSLPAEQNIRDLCFMPDGILFNEFDQIFSDLFTKDKERYRQIIMQLVDGPQSSTVLFEKLGWDGTGYDYEHLINLEKSGFVSRDYAWHLQSGNVAKLSQYRLSDNYCRFYLKYILPNHHRVLQNAYADISLSSLENWSTIMGLQIENLILNNRHLIRETLGLKLEDVVFDGPYFQTATARKKGCQIDYLIQTRFNTLYLCEIKYSKNPIQKSVITDIQQKISALKIPKNFSIRPVLIHCNSISDVVEECQFFAKIINFTEYLT